MEFVQIVRDCNEHRDCTVIVYEQDGKELADSHAPSSIAPESRFNQTHPDTKEAHDQRQGRRGRLTRRAPTPDEVAALNRLSI